MFEYCGDDYQFALVELDDGEREIQMILLELSEHPGKRILTNKIGSNAHYDKFFAINRDADSAILDLLVTLEIVEKPNSVVFTRNGSVTVYRLKKA